MSTHRDPHATQRGNTRRRKIITINHEAMQSISTLGAIDPETGVRYYWQPDEAINWLQDQMRDPNWTPDRYCSRCKAYDFTLGIYPHELYLEKKGRREIRIENPVSLPWKPSKPKGTAKLELWHKSRPGRPAELDACHMCLVSYLDETYPPELSDETQSALRKGWRDARDEVARLNRSKARESRPFMLPVFERLLTTAKRRLYKFARACQDHGVRVRRAGARRCGDDPPMSMTDPV